MTPTTDAEWQRVQEALVKGGLRKCIDDLLSRRPFLSEENRRIIYQAYDDGDGNVVRLVPTEDPPWFAGLWEAQTVMFGMEHRGTLYSIVLTGMGGDACLVVVGEGLVTNEMGIAFDTVGHAKAYVKGLTAK